MDAEIHADCELCESHGNPMATEIQKFEVVAPKKVEVVAAPHTGPIKPVSASVNDRLAAMLAEAAESDEDEDEEEDADLGEVAFQEDEDGDLDEEEFEEDDD
jgi:hypothetical protein